MDLSKYSKEEICDKLAEALKVGANHLENSNRLGEENKKLWIQLSKHIVSCGGTENKQDVSDEEVDPEDVFLIKLILAPVTLMGVLACLYHYITH